MDLTRRCYYCGCPQHPNMWMDWTGNIACTSHYDAHRICDCCKRMIGGRDIAYKEVEPNRFICQTCLDNEVTEQNFNWVKDQVLRRLYKVGFQDLQCDWINFKIISKKVMEDNCGTATGFHLGYIILNQNICVLSHMNKIYFAGVLAHELLHSWQMNNNLNEFNDYHQDPISVKVCEGMAQMGSFLIYDTIDHPFARWKRDEMFRIQDENYGRSFQKIYARFKEIANDDKNRWYGIIREARTGKLRTLFYRS